MQHEVLLALSGYPGNAFTVCRETGLFEVSVYSTVVKSGLTFDLPHPFPRTHTHTQVTADLPFIHPSEVSLLNRVCRLGTYYLRIKSFIEDQSAASVTLAPHPKERRSVGE